MSQLAPTGRFFLPATAGLSSYPFSGIRFDRIRALLAYLAANPDLAQWREALAALLWPNV